MKQRSTWGWGWAERFPARAARQQVGVALGAVLGLQPTGLYDPVPLEDIELPKPRMAVPPSLVGRVDVTRRTRVTHTYGKNFPDQLRGFTGQYPSPPDMVAFPETDEDIVRILAWADANRVAVVPFGGGTSVVGGVSCNGDGFAGVLSLDMRRLNRVLEVQPMSRLAHIQAGATGPELQHQLAEHNLTLRHYPQSYEFSTLGGWVATRAGGHYATVYTHIDDLVAATHTITPVGALETRCLPGSGAGPSPDRHMIGSEGALGVITSAWIRVQAPPRFRSKASVQFERFEDAVEATRALAQSGLHPANCRLLDSREAAMNQVVSDGSCVLVLGFESADHENKTAMTRAIELAQDAGGSLPKPARHTDSLAQEADSANGGAGDRWRQAFFDTPYLQGTLLSLGMIADTFETACPWHRFEALHRSIIKTVRDTMKATCGQGFIGCRFTHVYPDGPAPYYTFIAPGDPDPSVRLEQWQTIKRAASDTLMAHRATITHHHAVGRLHQPWYDTQRPALFGAALTAAKRTLDPNGILNPGVLCYE